MTKNALLPMLVILATTPVFARRIHKGSRHDLCSIKSVFVDGNSESADIVRQRIEKKTWLKLVPSEDGADGVLKIAEHTLTKHFPISTQETEVSDQLWKGKKLDWSETKTWDEGVFNSGSGSAARLLLDDLNKEANCE
ncbi:MAG: hypothetical protein EPN47_15930 [Acidobacteria bacterium]|nr:MAG: hypothetical protein EPN47_15930 [Acidobacteriota bacterium]